MTTRAAPHIVLLLALAVVCNSFAADESPSAPPVLKVPDGFTIELVAGPPLVERPIVAAFDDDGRLYVAESSGSNDPVQQQLAEKPHRIVRLEDTNDDGTFDRRSVFADKMMFPEGAMFFDGSLYVAAPPSIWKLTDRDGDGVADERVEWFQGKTLTGCANDLHGPYAGPDGFIYWCKGAFAEQTHMVNGREWKTKAAHIFRCRPDGTDFEPVMTGGMDNPVDVAFMPDGERILSGTFFSVNPRHDGLIHAIYGGVYGKDHGVLAGHPRTGELMPILAPLSAAAGSGLERYDSDAFGAEYRDNLFLCQFNMRKVSRHILRPSGSTFTSEDSDFVSSDFVDFHPTDVLVDADGSLLVIDTGGWYKLCCPTSQLWKPDILGGIYRVKKVDSKTPDDPRGRQIAWSGQTPEQLWKLLADIRPAVRQRASREILRRGTREMSYFVATTSIALNAIERNGSHCESRIAALARMWTLAQLPGIDAQSLVREKLTDADEQVRHIALQSVSLRRDADTTFMVRILLERDSAANRRIAAEALGRIGDCAAVGDLLAAAAKADDRILQHSIIYALIELADAGATRKGLVSESPEVVTATLIALDQMPGGALAASEVIPHLNADDVTLHNAARWVVGRHPDWGSELTEWLREQLRALPDDAQNDPARAAESSLENLLVGFSADAAVQKLLADTAVSIPASRNSRQLALRAMARANLRDPPPVWIDAIGALVDEADEATLPLAVTAARALSTKALSNTDLVDSLAGIAESREHSDGLRVDALSVIAGRLPELSDSQFKLLEQSLAPEKAVSLRSAAADAIAKSHLSLAQLDRLCNAVRLAGPLEVNRLLTPYEASQDDELGLKLVASLRESAAMTSVRIDVVRAALAKYGPSVQERIAELESLVNVDAAAQRKHIEELLPLVAKGDVRRGHAVYYNSKAACAACHRLGHAGGTTAPELTHVGKTRTERDLLESILYPSLSFVRSYEPVLITTQEGKVINGVIQDENANEYVVATGPDQSVRVPRADVDEIQPSTVSIMPAGLDKQLTTQELADLVAFLKSATNH
jgi:putative membrane-bound dehydrogenase-like protein